MTYSLLIYQFTKLRHVNCDAYIKNEIALTIILFWEQCLLSVVVPQKIPLKSLLQIFQKTKTNFLINVELAKSENIHNNSNEITIQW